MKLQKEHNKMRDRFDLEQDIMQCWGIIDDLKNAHRAGRCKQNYC